jgi:hypothetical protein
MGAMRLIVEVTVGHGEAIGIGDGLIIKLIELLVILSHLLEFLSMELHVALHHKLLFFSISII